ncbi:uncharacterized protein Z519_05674 [Cladophialophora bantiana CBS 173.52]|uniref:Uncharacterized protein n=1 Tax=Cladophialophora bantiana (strain ATCC 10958 / CBS 173.52 / CDC B-1940 / NIH 8579) TaxID=1442370 RepID=A0A0D2I8D7_CLAB1|nr:uncharacterized protein Z519_05674 [Cladophialophora bantiana CBS 173.52]KIW93069.1 hypothetical protein Z519_05674 [Cladophialophora bantiana CBS 173.52]
MKKCQIRSLNVKADMQRAFNQYIQNVHQDLVWTGVCTNKDKATNKITAVWPGSSIHYMKFIEQPRWEDFEIEYQKVCAVQTTWSGSRRPLN